MNSWVSDASRESARTTIPFSFSNLLVAAPYVISFWTWKIFMLCACLIIRQWKRFLLASFPKLTDLNINWWLVFWSPGSESCLWSERFVYRSVAACALGVMCMWGACTYLNAGFSKQFCLLKCVCLHIAPNVVYWYPCLLTYGTEYTVAVCWRLCLLTHATEYSCFRILSETGALLGSFEGCYWATYDN